MDNPEQVQATPDQEVQPGANGATVNPMESLMASEDFAPQQHKPGDVLRGTIVKITSSEILVDIGSKSEGIITGRELEKAHDIIENLQVGQQITTYIVRPEDKEGNVVLSLGKIQQEQDWQRAEQLHESQEVFPGVVTGYNRGGVIVRVGKLRGFVPASQLANTHRPEAGEEDNPEARWQAMQGQELKLKVIEIDRKRNRLILSERAAVRDARKENKEKLLTNLQKGDQVRGRISSIANFGAFVDLGGADGLIHLSELSWGRVNHPSEVVKVGDEVDVQVLNVDKDKRRIGLSLRRLQPEPWKAALDRYKVGQLVRGTITKLANFGAFARVDGDIEGLIHISELSTNRVNHPREVVQEGQELDLRIIRIDPERRRMGLSLKRVPEEQYAEYDWQAAEDDTDTMDVPDMNAVQDDQMDVPESNTAQNDIMNVADVNPAPNHTMDVPAVNVAQAEGTPGSEDTAQPAM